MAARGGHRLTARPVVTDRPERAGRGRYPPASNDINHHPSIFLKSITRSFTRLIGTVFALRTTKSTQ